MTTLATLITVSYAVKSNDEHEARGVVSVWHVYCWKRSGTVASAMTVETRGINVIRSTSRASHVANKIENSATFNHNIVARRVAD